MLAGLVRFGLQPTGRREGVSRKHRPHAGRGRSKQRRRSAQDQTGAAAHQDLGFLGRLRRYRQRPWHEKFSWRKAVYDRAYRENVTFDPGIPNQVMPALLPYSRPIHEIVPVRCLRSRLSSVHRHNFLRTHGVARRPPARRKLENAFWIVTSFSTQFV